MDTLQIKINGTYTDFTWDQLKEKLGYSDEISSLQAQVGALNDTAAWAENSSNISWLLSSAFLVFIMQAGFTLLEVGSVRLKNTKSILVKNIIDACVGSLMFYLVGFGFAFGRGNAFIGWTGFALHEGFTEGTGINKGSYNGYQYAFWFFQFAFSATASTIVSGAVAERTKLSAYCMYTFVLSFIVYPAVAHWAWSQDGWASPFNSKKLFGVGVIDFAGGCVVHVLGGTSAFLGAFILGPRKGRFGKHSFFMPQQNATFQVLGTLLLWFGWYGFNTGSTLLMHGNTANVAALVAANTTLSASVSGFTVMMLGWGVDRKFEPSNVCNGILAGLVSITAGCSVIEPELTLVTGCLGGVIYYWSSKLLMKMEVDDVVNASPVHLCCGLWSTIAAGLFAKPSNVQVAYAGSEGCGLLYGGKGGYQLAANLLFAVTVIGWTSLTVGVTFMSLKIARQFRVTGGDEDLGLDIIGHGGIAYENPVATSKA